MAGALGCQPLRATFLEENLTTKDAINHFGGVMRLAAALGIWPQAVYKWGEYPPHDRQIEMEVITEGALKAEKDARHD